MSDSWPLGDPRVDQALRLLEDLLPVPESSTPQNGAEAAEAKLEHSVSREQLLTRVFAQHHVQKARIAVHRNHFLPIHQLPNELLSEIFILSRRGLETAELDNTRLALVCSRWRNVMTATTLLFARITLRYEQNVLVNRRAYLERYLRLSGGQPLSVLAELIESYDEITMSRGDRAMIDVKLGSKQREAPSELVPFIMARCASLRILRPPSSMLPNRFVPFLEGSYPQLRNLEINIDHSPYIQQRGGFIPLRWVSDCTNLESIIISGTYYYVGCPYSLEGPGIFSNVTRLSLRNGQFPHSAFKLLRQVPNLVFLSWFDEGRTGPDFEFVVSNEGLHSSVSGHPGALAQHRGSEYLAFPFLQELRLSGAVPIMTLRHIEAPSLQSAALFAYNSNLHESKVLEKAAVDLVFDRLTEPDGWPLLSKLELYRPSDPSLMFAVLSFQEKLEELTIHDLHQDDQLMALLDPLGPLDDGSGDIACCNLRRLKITTFGCSSEENSRMLAVMESLAELRTELANVNVLSVELEAVTAHGL